MSPSTLHVLSRGRAPEHDYRWVAVEPGLHPPRGERPPRLDARAAQLVQSDTPSLLVLRVGGELVLFVTALESTRTDVQGRPIRNAFALTVPDVEEGVLRGVSAAALDDGARVDLAAEVDAAVLDHLDGGFDVDPELLERLFARALPTSEETLESERRFGPNGIESRAALAEELRTRPLPPGEGLLVVVTGALGADRLEASGAWRGLSRLVNEPFARPLREVRPRPKKGRGATALLLAAAALLTWWILWPPRSCPGDPDGVPPSPGGSGGSSRASRSR